MGSLPGREGSAPSRADRATVGLAEGFDRLGHDVAVAATHGDPASTSVPARTDLARTDLRDADILSGRLRHGVVPAPGLDVVTLLGLAEPDDLRADGGGAATEFTRTQAALGARGADCVVATTPTSARLAGEADIDVDEVIPLGAAEPFHAPDAYDGGLDLLFVGRMRPDRLPHWLAEETPEAYDLALIGPGKAPYTRGIGSYRGVVGEDALRQAYRRAGAFVYPTTGDGFPLTAAEALAAGTPLVAPADTPAGEVVAQQGLGRTFPRGDADALRAALRELFWERRPDRCREFAAEELAWERICERYLGVYRAL